MPRKKKPSGGKPPKLVGIGYDAAIKAFARAGFHKARQAGDHVILVKEGYALHLSLPAHRPVAVGTLKQLIESAGLTAEQFLDLL